MLQTRVPEWVDCRALSTLRLEEGVGGGGLQQEDAALPDIIGRDMVILPLTRLRIAPLLSARLSILSAGCSTAMPSTPA